MSAADDGVKKSCETRDFKHSSNKNLKKGNESRHDDDYV